MKRIITILFLIFSMFVGEESYSQCNTNVSICTPGVSGPFNFIPASGQVGTCQDFINGTGAPNYAYIMVNITSSGPLSLLINGNSGGGFIDVSVFLIPPGQTPCAAIQNNANQLGCNYATAASGCNQFGNFFGCPSTAPAPNVTAGDLIMVVIEDWSNQQNTFTLQLGGGANAQTGPYNATITPVGTQSTTGPSIVMNAATGGGTWTASCGSCINATTGQFNPAAAGPGNHTICYSVGQPPCAGNDCQVVTVTAPCTMTASTSSSNVSCNGQNNGSASVSPSNGTAPYSYSWSNSSSSASINSLSPGTYNVTITDGNGCTASSSTTISQPSALNFSTNSNNETCAGNNGSVTSNVSGGTSGYSYSWSHNGGLSTSNASGLNAGSYTVTVTDANGCTQSSSETITQTGAVSSGFNYNGNQCLTGNSFVFTNTGTAGVSYIWDFGDGGTSTSQNPIHTYGTAGTYTVTQTVINGVCTDVTSTSVTVYPAPTSTISGVAPLCNGDNNGSVNLTPTGGTAPYGYSWSNGAISQDLSNLTSGTFNVTISDNNGCLTTNTITLNNPAILTVSTSNTAASCEGVCNGTLSSTPAGGTTPYSYSWTGGSNVQNPTSQCDGTYFLTITDNNGCVVTSSETINNATVFTASGTDVDATCGASNGSASVTTSGGTGGYTYAWSPSGQTSQTASNIAAGDHDITVTDVNGCQATTTITVGNTAGPSANISASSDINCYGGSDGDATVTAAGGTGAYTYSWSPTGGSTSTGANLSANINYTVTVSDANNCVATASITLNEPSQLNVTTSAIDAHCSQSDGSLAAIPTGGTTTYTYDWDNGSGSVGTTMNLPNMPAGNYTFTVTDFNSCVATSSITINDLAGGTVAATNTNVSCNSACDATASATMTGGIAPISYLWDNSGASTSPNITGLCPGTYTINIVDGVGCTSSAAVTVTEPAVLASSISTFDDVTCYGDTDGTATVVATGGTPNYSYLWNDASAQTTAVATNLAPGAYTVLVTDGNGCQTSSSVTINEPTEIQLAGGDIDAHCNLPDGLAYVSVVNGGVSPFSYAWSNTGSTTDTSFNSTPGIATATVTDTDGCIQTLNITVGDIPAGIATISNVVNVSCNNICDGSLTVSMSGSGTAPYTYLWNDPNAQTAVTATGLCDGTFDVMVTDANGCISNVSSPVTEPQGLGVVLVPTNPLCFESCDGVFQAQVSGGTAPYNYQWDDPLLQTSHNATGLCGDGTIYNVLVTDANGCTISKGAFLTDPPELVMDSTVVNAHCGLPDGSACVSLSGGTGSYSVIWQYNNSTNLCETGLISNTYVVDGTDANGCADQISVTVSDLSGPTASITNQTDVTCYAGSDAEATATILGGVVPYAYAWDANAGNQITPTATNLSEGTYALTITDASGCVASTSVTIVQPDSIQLYGTVTHPSCYQYDDGQIVVTSIGGITPHTYLWDDPNAQTTGTATQLAAATYNIILTDANGCTNIDTYMLSDPLPFSGVAVSTDNLCNASCDGTGLVTPVNGISPLTYQWNDPNSQTTNSVTGLCAGTFEVIITDAMSCADTLTILVNEPTVLTAQINTSGNVSCNGFCDGFADALVQGGTAPYSYLWSNGATTALASNLCAGNYVCNITDANGCTTSTNIQITEPIGMSGVMSFTDVVCYGDQNGYANFAVAGGVLPYAFQWDDLNFQTTQNASNVYAGTYNVVVTDANGCVLNETVTIGQPTQLVANVATVNSNCGQNNGQICVSVAGGTVPYLYSWNDPNSQTTACALSITAGTYTVNIVDGNGCTLDSIININDVAGPTITLNSILNPSCNGLSDGNIDMSLVGGTIPYATYHWIDAYSNTVGASNVSILPSIGDGCYTLEVIDAAGCYTAMTQCITEPNPLNSSILYSVDVNCFSACNGAAIVSSLGGTLPHNITWNTGATTNGITNLCAGSYQANIIDGNGCTTNATTTIVEPPQLISSILSTQNTSCNSSCDGIIEAGSVGGVTPYSYTWNPNVSSSATGSSLCAGGYSITTIDGNGCSASVSATVNSPAPLLGSLSSVDATCGLCNGTVTFNPIGGTAPYTYLWDNGQTTQTATNVCMGIFGGTVTDANGCSLSLVVNVVNIPGPQVNTIVWTPPTCFGVSNGTAVPDISGGTASYSFSWPSSGQTTQTAVGLAAGAHCFIVTDANGCVANACVNITQPSQLVAVPDMDTIICYGDSTQIWANGQGGTAPYIIDWTSPNASTFSGQGPIFVNPLTTQGYCFRVTDANGCASSVECVDITVTPSLNVQLPPDLFICAADSFEIVGAYTGGNGDPYSYAWYRDSYPSAIVSTDSNYTVLPTTPTWYYAVLTDGCSLPVIDSIYVEINPSPVAFINVIYPNGVTQCEPGIINFIGNSDIGVTYEWDYECDGNIDYSNTNTTTSHVYPSGVFDVCLTVISADGCSTLVMQPGGVEVYENPTADFTFLPETTTMADPFVTVMDTTGGITSWYWDFDNDGVIDDSTGNTTSYEFDAEGEYDILLIVMNANGCYDTISMPITVLPYQNIFVPNAFSPDGDGKNDFFYVKGIGLDLIDFDLYVYNRWGEVIWEGHNPTDRWDGRIEGRLVETEVYVWKLQTIDIEGKKVEYVGHVTLVR